MDIDGFITRWRSNEGGAERANFPLFLTELAEVLGLPRPDPAGATHAHNDYVFERAVTFRDQAGRCGHGRIDLYKRGCFVLEAKQSRERGRTKEVALSPAPPPVAPVADAVAGDGRDADEAAADGSAAPRGRRSAHRGWDVLMRNAREQAEQYARALPPDHGWPPFILVCDVGHAIEVFADFSGQGKNYCQFPDRAGFRIYLDDLRQAAVQDRLRAIWTDPHSLDPARRSAAVTRDIARRLASVSKLLEERGYRPEPVAHFLMRCLFTMFAEDTGLLHPDGFKSLLGEARHQPDSFAPLVEELWQAMDQGLFSTTLRRKVRHFNGGLFADRSAIPLRPEEIGELYEAAKHDWTEVEPAIFGTLLERALNPKERAKLGAHYTPRAYVERLIGPTIMEPLRADWTAVRAASGQLIDEGKADEARAFVEAFHARLAQTKVLDPACGTGNFLYVAMARMKELEGEVLVVAGAEHARRPGVRDLGEEGAEGEHEHHGGERVQGRRRAGACTRVDLDRHGLGGGPGGQERRDDEVVDRGGEHHHQAGEDGGAEQRQQHESQCLHARGAEVARGFLVLAADRHEAPADDHHHERQRERDVAQQLGGDAAGQARGRLALPRHRRASQPGGVGGAPGTGESGCQTADHGLLVGSGVDVEQHQIGCRHGRGRIGHIDYFRRIGGWGFSGCWGTRPRT